MFLVLGIMLRDASCKMAVIYLLKISESDLSLPQPII